MMGATYAGMLRAAGRLVAACLLVVSGLQAVVAAPVVNASALADTGCVPAADQVALFVDYSYGGTCVIAGFGDYNFGSVIGNTFPNDALSSVKVGSNVRLLLYQDWSISGGATGAVVSLTADTPDLRSVGIDNIVSSFRVESRVGNDDSPRGSRDGFTNFTVFDTNHPTTCGVLYTFSYYASVIQPIRFVLADASWGVRWVSDEITPTVVGKNTYTLASPITVARYWKLGYYTKLNGTIPYNNGGGAIYYTGSGVPVVGTTLPTPSQLNRQYSWVTGILPDSNCPADSSGPAITTNVTGTQGTNGWYRSSVTLTWSVSDPESGVASSTGCVNNLVSFDTPGATYICTATNGVGLSSSNSVTIKRDATAPSLTMPASQTVEATGPSGAVVSYPAATASDATSGVAGVSCSPASGSTFPIGATTVQCTATDNAGNQTSGSVTVTVRDSVAPTISGAPDRAANSNGWYNADVTVAFTCSDRGSGIASCGPNATLGQGASQSVTGTARDNAGNTASATVSGINVDKTAPTINGAATTQPNASGWYRGDVTIAWTCSDALSGLAGACPGNSTISGEGASQTASASVSDKAGNTSSASVAVKIDRTAPNTTANAPSGWSNASSITVALTPSDNLSGVASTSYTLDGGAQQTGTSVAITAEGVHTLQFWSVDKAGNVEAAKTAQVKIDRTAPNISHSQAPAANQAGWNNADVTVTFTCSDPAPAPGVPPSGIASCGPTPQTVTTQGQNQQVTGSAADNAGNSATDNATVSLDKARPTISGAADRAANANGWYNADVTVAFTCADALSGIVACGPNATLGEGANQSATGTATDAAGNAATATVSGVNVDKTKPTISGAATTQANAYGWYRGDVAVSWTCSDSGGSGLTGACPSNSTITGEGASLAASASIDDKAGNTGSATVTVKIDRAAPSTHASVPAPLPSGWYAAPVAVTLTAQDGLSGVDQTIYSLDGAAPQAYSAPFQVGGGIHQVTFWSVDKAGNVEDNTAPTRTITVKVDNVPPAISASATTADGNAYTAGTWTSQDVTVTFTCADAESGIAAGGCPAPATITGNGANQSASGTATDNAGNTASATFDKIMVDKAAPAITAARAPAANGAGWNNSAVTVTFTCADQAGLSGIASCSAPGTLASEGSDQSASGSAADAAGNSATTSLGGINIDVTGPTLGGVPTGAPSGTDPAGTAWFSGDVTIHWTADDALSGVNPATIPADSTITGEGKQLTASAAVSDQAGNLTKATSQPVNIDRTPPRTTGNVPSGWSNTGITVTLAPSDNLSGVKATSFTLDGSAPQVGTSVAISTEGAHSLSFWSEDYAGNVEPATTVQVKIDRSAPSITHALSPEPNAAGWNNADVTVTFLCGDSLSGLASCTAPQTVAAEGKDELVTGSVIDNAGNSNTDTAKVSLDKTAPTITAARAPAANASGWNNSAATVTFTCADALSGIATCTSPITLATEGAGQSASGAAVDAAGNSASASVTGINVDLTAPTITGAPDRASNPNGWYNAGVTVTFTCSDALSGVATCAAPVQLQAEAANQSASGAAADKAGNSASASVAGVNIDKTAPAVSYAGNAGTYTIDQSVSITCTAADALSGVASTTCQNVTGAAYTFALGANTFSASATDRAGNTGTGSTTFTVKSTATSLCALTRQFVSGSGASGISNSLCSKLSAADAASARGNATAKSNALDAYVNEVSAQTGKSLTAGQAAILTGLARSL